MSLFDLFRSCMNRRKADVSIGNEPRPNYNEYLETFTKDNIPESIKDLLVYIAREGVAVTDLFRRPGNTQYIKRAIHQLKVQQEHQFQTNHPEQCKVEEFNCDKGIIVIDWTRYNFYTLANIVKRFLIQINNGILGADIEQRLIDTLDLPDDQTRIESMSRILKELQLNVRHLLALLFGTWFRMIYHSDVNAMSVESVAKSVAGSIFPSCTNDPVQVNKASKVMEYLITGFASSELFGKELIEYFTNVTQTSISRIEKFKYEFVYPKNISQKKSTRLFVRMLLEEANKHGFDLLKDEVTEDEFNAIDNCTKLNDSTCVNNHLPSRKRRLSSDGNINDELLVTSRLANQVQQTSEKRTCVTATADSSTQDTMDSQNMINENDASGDVDSYGKKLGDSVLNESNCDDREITGLRTTSSTLEFDINHQESAHNHNHSSSVHLRNTNRSEMDKIIRMEIKQMACNSVQTTEKPSELTGGPGGVRFSRVKRQQLERLQKRSDWFLSPPSGCKADGLMQLTLTPLDIFSPRSDLSMSIYSDDQENTNIRTTRFLDFYEPAVHRKDVVSQTLPSGMVMDFAESPKVPLSEKNDKDLSTEVRNSSGISEDEVEIRYFVVKKYYGAQNPNLEPPNYMFSALNNVNTELMEE